MADQTGNVTIDFAREIMDHIETLVDEKSEQADVWAQSTIDASKDRAAYVSATAVTEQGSPVKPGLPDAPVLPDAPEIGAVSPAPFLGGAPALPDRPEMPPVPDIGDLDASDMVSEAKTIRLDLIAELKAALEEFAQRWFPPGQYLEKATAWLERVIDGGATIDAVVEAKTWERDRARLMAEANRATDEAMTLWAGRGYTLPPGALAHQVLTVNQGVSNALSQQSRDIAIKAHQDELETAKFAVQQAIGLRTAAMSAAINFIQALASSMAQAIQLTSAQADALARIASAKATIFSAEVDAETKIFGSIAGANTDVFKAEMGAKADMYRAEVAGFQAKTGAETDVYRAVTSVEMDRFRTLASALSDFYRAETGASELTLRAKTVTAQMDLEAQRANQAAELSQIQETVKAFMANASQLAAQCAAAIQGLRMSASVGNTSSTQMQLKSV